MGDNDALANSVPRYYRDLRDAKDEGDERVALHRFRNRNEHILERMGVRVYDREVTLLPPA